MQSAKVLSMRYILALLFAALVLFFGSVSLQAAPIGTRSLALSDSKLSATATHDFSIEITSGAVLGSIELEYCANNPLVGTACTVPTGLDLTSAILSSQTGETAFAIDGTSTANRILLTRVPVVPGVIPSPSTYQLDDIVNPDTAGTYYVRLSSFATADGTGARTEEGGIAFSVVEGFNVTAYVPPFLDFCVGVSISGSGCSTVVGSALDMGIFDSLSSSTTASQFRAATNGQGGYNISMIGQTMTSGSNVIPNLSTPQASSPGSSQFGVNLRDNSSPNVGTNITGAGTGTPTANYNIPNQFAFNNGDVIAASSLSTEYNTYTLSYLVNIVDSQAVGIYVTTLTFVALASF